MMNKLFPLIALIAVMFVSCEGDGPIVPDVDPAPFPTNIDIPSLDGLNINANVYEIGADAPVIVLCHQARFNKFEYAGIGERLNELGFNCIAIDQRSGGPIANKTNWTNYRAIEQGKAVDYLDAVPDITAAVNFASKAYKQKVILWGSSYSSTLVLYEAMENDNVSAVISFSPGDYFAPEKGSLTEMLTSFKKPMFVTSSLREAEDLTKMVAGMTLTDKQDHFIPESSGYHGSRALWKGQPDGEEYWTAIEAFLKKIVED